MQGRFLAGGRRNQQERPPCPTTGGPARTHAPRRGRRAGLHGFGHDRRVLSRAGRQRRTRSRLALQPAWPSSSRPAAGSGKASRGRSPRQSPGVRTAADVIGSAGNEVGPEFSMQKLSRLVVAASAAAFVVCLPALRWRRARPAAGPAPARSEFHAAPEAKTPENAPAENTAPKEGGGQRKRSRQG